MILVSLSATSIFFRSRDADIENGICPCCGNQSLVLKVHHNNANWYRCRNEGCPIGDANGVVSSVGIIDINDKLYLYPKDIAKLRRWASSYHMSDGTSIPKPGDKGSFRSRLDGVLNVVVDYVDEDGVHVHEDVRPVRKKLERWFSVKSFSPVPLKPQPGDKVTFKRGEKVVNLNNLDVGGKTVKVEEVSYKPSPVDTPAKAAELRKFPRVKVYLHAAEPPRKYLISIRQFVPKK